MNVRPRVEAATILTAIAFRVLSEETAITRIRFVGRLCDHRP